jgi:hypothetical protein
MRPAVPLLDALFKVGLQQERAEKLKCTPDTTEPAKATPHCEVLQDAFLNVADATFTVGGATKADIGVGINVIENVFGDDGHRDKTIDKTTELETNQTDQSENEWKRAARTRRNKLESSSVTFRAFFKAFCMVCALLHCGCENSLMSGRLNSARMTFPHGTD